MATSSTGVKQCFVIMPYGGSDQQQQRHFRGVYESIIKPAAERAGYEVRRSDISGGPGNITGDIIRDLAESELVIADLTGGNANVLFELGIRHVFRKSGTVHIVDKAQPIPFDVRQYRAVQYSTDLAEIPGVLGQIVDAIKKREHQPDRSDNPVHDTISGLPADFREVGEEAQLRQIEELQESLEQVRKDRDDLEAKLMELDPAGSIRKQPSASDVDVLLDQAEEMLRSTGEYVLLRLKQSLEEGGRDAFLAELRSVLKSPYLTENDFMELTSMCIQLDLVDHRRVVLEIGHDRYPSTEEIFLALVDAYDDSPVVAIQQRGRLMLEEFLHVKRKDGDRPEVQAGTGRPNSFALNVLCNGYFRAGHPDWVLSVCDSLLSQEFSDVVVLRNKARALDELGKVEEGEAAFVEALNHYPDSGIVHRWFGDALDRSERYREAYEQYELGAIVDPQNAASHSNLGIQILNRQTYRNSDGQIIGPVSRQQSLKVVVPLFVRAVELGSLQTRKQVVAVMVREDAVQEARAISQGRVPEGRYDTSVIDYINSKVAERVGKERILEEEGEGGLELERMRHAVRPLDRSSG